MKKYIYLSIALALGFIAVKGDWVISGNEAIAATKQVLRGDDFVTGRITQDVLTTVQSAIKIISGLFGLLAAYFFISEHNTKQNENENETKN